MEQEGKPPARVERKEAPRFGPTLLRSSSLQTVLDLSEGFEIPRKASILDLVFNVTRARLARVPRSLPVYLRVDGDLQATAPPNVIRLRVDPSRSRTENHRIVVSSFEEQLDLIKLVFRDAHRAAILVLAPDFENPAAGWKVFESELQSAIGHSQDAKDLVEERRIELDAITAEPERSIREYFFQLDIHTNQKLWDQLGADTATILGNSILDQVYAGPSTVGIGYQQVRAALTGVMAELDRRMSTRVDYWKNGPLIPMFLQKPEAGLIHEIKTLSSLLLVVEQSTILQPGVVLPQAFNQFASGHLRDRRQSLAVDYQPRSGYFFFFGEFALLAIDTDVDKQEWEQRFRIGSWLDSQAVHAESYRGPGNSKLAPPAPGALVAQGRDANYKSYGPDTWVEEVPKPWMSTRYSMVEWFAQQACETAFAYLGALPPPPTAAP